MGLLGPQAGPLYETEIPSCGFIPRPNFLPVRCHIRASDAVSVS